MTKTSSPFRLGVRAYDMTLNTNGERRRRRREERGEGERRRREEMMEMVKVGLFVCLFVCCLTP